MSSDISDFLGVDTKVEILNAYKRRRVTQIERQKNTRNIFKKHGLKLDELIKSCTNHAITKDDQIYLADLRKSLVEVSVELHDALNSFHRGNNISPQYELFDKSYFDQEMKGLEKDLEILIGLSADEVTRVKKKLYTLSQVFLRHKLFGDRVE